RQLRVETVPIMQDELDDLSGANKTIEVKLFGPEHKELRELAKKVGEMLEKNGAGRGIKEVSKVALGNPDVIVDIDVAKAKKLGLTPNAIIRQLKAMYQGQIATQVRESAQWITDVRVRYPANIRSQHERFDPAQLKDHLILLPADAKPDSKSD